MTTRDDDARRCAGLDPIQQEVGEQERRQVVDGERVLEAVDGLMSVGPEATDVVDQHIQPWLGAEDSDGKAPYLRLRRHVGREPVDS